MSKNYTLKNRYTEEKIEELLKNKYVKSCNPKRISFTKECKVEALNILNNEKCSSKEIFRQLNFPDFIINSKTPGKAINKWKNKLKDEKSFEWILKEENKKQKKKINENYTELWEFIKLEEDKEKLEKLKNIKDKEINSNKEIKEIDEDIKKLENLLNIDISKYSKEKCLSYIKYLEMKLEIYKEVEKYHKTNPP